MINQSRSERNVPMSWRLLTQGNYGNDCERDSQKCRQVLQKTSTQKILLSIEVLEGAEEREGSAFLVPSAKRLSLD